MGVIPGFVLEELDEIRKGKLGKIYLRMTSQLSGSFILVENNNKFE